MAHYTTQLRVVIVFTACYQLVLMLQQLMKFENVIKRRECDVYVVYMSLVVTACRVSCA